VLVRPVSKAGVTPRMRLLFALGFTPRLDAPHGGRASAAVIRALAAGHDVAVLYLRDGSLPEADDSVTAGCVVVDAIEGRKPASGAGALLTRARLALGLARGKPIMVSHTDVAAFGRRLRSLVDRFDADVVHFEPTEMAQYASTIDRSRARHVVVVHEPGLAAATERHGSFPLWRRAARRLDLLSWSRFERRIGAQADLLIALTERDERALRAVTEGRIVRVPLAIPVPERRLDPIGGDPPSVIFVGGYMHPPNEDAALRLLRSIWPRVRESRPDAVLELVGDRPTPSMLAAGDVGVTMRGRVPELEPLLDRAAAVVLPIRLGGGMRVKAIEALAAGKAVVASRRAIEGLDLADGQQLLLAETDAEFVAATVRLLGDIELRRRLATAARAWAETHVSVDAVASAYAGLYASLLTDVEAKGRPA
jgi:glycosyltransferase involved in cell wall biosynthesis